MPRGKWDTLPCRYSDLATDPKLRRWIRWGLERVRTDLLGVGGRDTLAMHLAHEAMRLLTSIPEPPLFPARRELDGLAWTLKLDRLWELYVAAHVSGLARHAGGHLYLCHKGQAVFPLQWTDPGLRSLGHLTPDLVLRRHD
jgi:hypothetical protein